MARRRSPTWLLRLALAVAVSFVTVDASAGDSHKAARREPTPADIETALQLYKEGKQRRDKGDLPGALEKLRAAHALVETPITAFELGRTLALTGQLVEAREVLLSVARIPVRKNESRKAAQARMDSESLAADIEPRLGSILVKVSGEPPPSMTIRVDGVVVPPEAASSARIVNPGPHVVELEANGKTSRAEVTVAEGQAAEVSLDAPVDTPSTANAEPPPASADTASSRSSSVLVYAGFGAAALGVTIGTVTGIMTLSKASSLDEVCRGDRCPPDAQGDLDSVSTTGAISTVSFIVGVIGAGVGVYGLLSAAPRSGQPASSGQTSQPSQARLLVTPLGVHGSF
jgi:hypothetical protein